MGRSDTLRTTAKSVGQRLGIGLLGLLISCCALGWLYLLRAPANGWPGPRIPDALILDELSGHSSVSLWAFLAVWGTTAVLLAGLARVLRLERLQAAFALTIGLGIWLLLLTGFALYVARQIPAMAAMRTATRTRTVYLPAAFAGVAGAIFGLPRSTTRSRAHGGFAWLVGAAGLLDIVSAITPEISRRLHTLGRIAPSSIPPLASATVVPVGVAMVLAARGLARGSRRAWQIAVTLLIASAILNLLKGLDYEEATATGLLAIALIARRQVFRAPGDPEARSRVLFRAFALGGAVYVYGAVALWINQSVADQPYSLPFALLETSRALIGLDVRRSHHVLGRFGSWFPLSVLLLGVVAVAGVVDAWLAPWRYRLRQEARERRLAHALVGRFGRDTLAPFTLRSDKSFFFSEDELVFLAYRVVGGVAIVSGDPVGPLDAVERVIERFLPFARERGWHVAFLGASERYLEMYRGHGLRTLYHGHEAVIDTSSFALEGRAIRKVRQACHRVDRAGYSGLVTYAGDLDEPLRRELVSIFQAWQGERPLKGFTMSFDHLFRLEGNEALFAIGRDGDGTARGFLHFAVSRPASALSLSSMPRIQGTPNGFNEWLIVQSVQWARENGFDRVSLNFAPFASLLGLEADLSRVQRAERRILRSFKRPLNLQLDNLLLFNDQFHPCWQPRYVVFERWTGLPRVGLAALSAEGYLPFGEKRHQSLTETRSPATHVSATGLWPGR